jgi:hypothetical protein
MSLHRPIPTPAEIAEVFRNDHAGTFLATDGRMFLKSVRNADSCFLFPFIQAPGAYPTGAFRQRVLEATLRELGAYGELTAAEVAFVKALDLPNLTLAALRDMPNIAPDGMPRPYSIFSLDMVFHSMR